MRIRVLSDLHNEFSVYRAEKRNSDIVVLAGDINLGISGAEWALKAFPALPVVYVAGNHEYYSQVIGKLHRDLREFSDHHKHFHFLENDEVIINGFRFLGCTLWSDFMLFGPEMEKTAREKSQQHISDFYRIKIQNNSYTENITTGNLINLFNESVDFLKQKLSLSHNGKTIVVTHHAPSAKSLPGYFRRDIVSSAIASNLDHLIETYQPELWIHGHTHHNVDYEINGTRVIANQRGYFPMQLCKKFDEDLIVEV